MGIEKGIMDLDFRAARNARDEFGRRTSRMACCQLAAPPAISGQSWPRPNNEKSSITPLTRLTQVFLLPGKQNAP